MFAASRKGRRKCWRSLREAASQFEKRNSVRLLAAFFEREEVCFVPPMRTTAANPQASPERATTGAVVGSGMRHRKAWVVTLTNEHGSFVLALWKPQLGDKEVAERLRMLHGMMCQCIGEQISRFQESGPLGRVEVQRDSDKHVSIVTTYEAIMGTHSTILEHSGDDGPQWVRFKPTPYSRAIWRKPIKPGDLPTFEPVELPEQRLDVLNLTPMRIIRLRSAP